VSSTPGHEERGTTTSLAAGSAWLLVTQGIANAGFFLTVLLLARGLDPAERGTTAFLTLSMLGIPEATAVRLARDRSGQATLVANLVISATVAGLAFSVAAASIIAATGSSPAGITSSDLLVVCAVVPVATVVYATVVLMIASGRTRPGAVLNMIHPWVYAVVLAAIVGLSSLNAHRAAIAWGIGMLASLVPALYVLQRYFRFGRPRLEPYVRVLRFGIWACVSETLKFLNFRLDQLLMGFITTEVVLGIYAVAVNASEILLYLPSATAAALLPIVARADTADQHDRTLRTFRILMVITIPGTLVAMAAGVFLIPLLFGSAYNASVSVFLLLVPGALGYTALTVFSSSALGSRMPVRSSLGAGTAFVIGIATLLVLVPRYGADGAALSATVAFLSGGAVQVLAHRARAPFPLRALLPGLSDVRDTLSAARRVAGAVLRRGRRVENDAPAPPSVG
jgi:O-antigen/teichoic acid export membrane protein